MNCPNCSALELRLSGLKETDEINKKFYKIMKKASQILGKRDSIRLMRELKFIEKDWEGDKPKFVEKKEVKN